MTGGFFTRRAARTLAPFVLAFSALIAGGCTCLKSRIESVIAPSRLRPEDKGEIRSMIKDLEQSSVRYRAAPILPAEIDHRIAHRCDFIDPYHCMFPFPNDFFTVEDPKSPTSRRVVFDSESMPRNVRGEPIDPGGWAASDGFSPGPLIVTYVPGLDLEQTGAPSLLSLSRSTEPGSPVLLIDAQEKKPVLLWAELDAQASQDDRRALLIHPAINLREGRRYVVVLRRLKNAQGEPIEPSKAFKIYRDGSDREPEVIEKRRPHFKEIFALLESMGIERRDLFLAWDFTVSSSANLSQRLLTMRDDAFEFLGDAAPVRKGLCAEEGFENVARRVWGAFEVPSYLEGRGGLGSSLDLGADGLPRRRGTLTAYFSCIIPQSAFTTPARLAIYGHGTLGSLDEVAASNVQQMANDHNIVFCATNWSGMALIDTVQAYKFLKNASKFPPLADRAHQGILNTLFLGRLMIHPKGLVDDPNFQRPDGAPLIDTSALFFDGNSQGALLGGTATAIAQDWKNAVLGVVGMRYSLILDRSSSFSERREGLPSLASVFKRSYDDLDRPLVLSLIQMLWDRVDLNGHARHLLVDRYPGTPQKSVLFHAAFGDQAVPNVTSEILARTLELPVREPVHARRDGLSRQLFEGIGAGNPMTLATKSAFVMWDTGACPTSSQNLAPNENGDPHGKLRGDSAVQRQKSAFLREGGIAVDSCSKREPCFACGGSPCAEICQETPSGMSAARALEDE